MSGRKSQEQSPETQEDVRGHHRMTLELQTVRQLLCVVDRGGDRSSYRNSPIQAIEVPNDLSCLHNKECVCSSTSEYTTSNYA